VRYPARRQHAPGWRSGMPANKRLRGFDVSEDQGLPIGHDREIALTSTFVIGSIR
jgi:hypothetical protein